MSKKDVYKLTNPQISIWNMEKFFEGTTINNICTTGTIYENVDLPLLKQAINNVVKKNDSFRIQLLLQDNVPYQTVTEFKPFDIDVLYVKDESEVKKIEQAMVNYKFNIINSVLFYFKIVVFGNGFCSIILNLSHIIADSWSLGLTIQEIIKEYHALKNNEILPETNNSYIDYIKSEQVYKNSEKYKNDKKYWEDIFSTIPEQATIPSVKKIKSNISNKANRKSFSLNAKLVKKINDFCKKEKLSVFNFLMAVYSIYLGRVSNLDDFVIGTPILNRTNFKDKHTTGMFVNTVPVRINIAENDTFVEFVHKVGSTIMSTLKHQKYSYNAILDDLRTKNKNIPNLYNMIISYQITKAFDENLGNYKGNWVFNNYCGNDFNIHISDINDTGELIFNYDYLIDKYSFTDVKNLHNRILSIINQIIEDTTITTDKIQIVTEKEKNKILYEFNNTAVDYPKNKTIVDLFEEQVEKTPNNIAVVCNNKSLTYKELNEKANLLANHLIKNNINNSDIVGIMVNRSLEMIIGLLGILKAGAAYLPLDPDYPNERISYILKDSNCKTILVNNNTSDSLSNNYYKINISLNSNIYKHKEKKNLNKKVNANDLIYLIYTSGSTGNPKGVMITHGNIINFINAEKQHIDFNSKKVMLSVTTISFDIFGLEIWCSLAFGMKVVIATDEEQTSALGLKSLCNKYDIDMIQTTPSRYSTLLNDTSDLEFLNNLSDIMVGGEPFPELLLKKLKKFTNANIWNMYGPTETTIWSTIKKMNNTSKITIGHPISNTTCYILDKNKNLLPPYTPGELYIGGSGVSKGYFKLNELTNTRFLQSTFRNDEIIYNTGDLAYYTNSGEIVHLGRTDFQIKIRGYRIELEEIENTILTFPGISSCIVTTTKDNSKLCAYCTSNDMLNIDKLKDFLSKKLPIYMIPNYFMQIEEFPYTPNGKIDKKALPLPQIDVKREIIGSRNKTDTFIINELKKLLNLSEISISDSFLEIGGDSLTAINLSTLISNKYNIDFTVKDIFEARTIENLSDSILNKEKLASNIKLVKASNCDNYHVSSAQKRVFFSSKLAGEKNILYNMPGIITFSQKPDLSKLTDCFNQLIDRHDIFRTSFKIIGSEVYQKINEDINFNITKKTDNRKLEDIFDDFVKPFDLSKAPLLRAKLIKNNNEYILLFDIHHIICDGLSLSIFINELSDLYNGKSLKPLTFRYVDYAESEFKALKQNLNTSKEYWTNQFKDDVPILNLPTDYPRPINQNFVGCKVHKIIDKNTLEKINNLSKNLNITPYMLLLSCYYILLSKYTLQDDITVGTAISGRTNKKTLNLIGMFVNSLPLRRHIDSSLKFIDFLNNIKQYLLESYEHSDYPFDELVKELDLSRDANRNPLFDTMFTYQNESFSSINFGGIKSHIDIPDTKISKFDLSLEIVPNSEHFQLNFEFATSLFDKSTIERLSNHYLNIIKAVTNNINIKIDEIDMLSNDEKDQILLEFNNTDTIYPRNNTVIQLFEEQVDKNPNDIAVVFEGTKLTYWELNNKANQLANYMKQFDLYSEDIIAILLDKSLEMIISILAILKLGCAYLPIDIDYPSDRQEYILKDSKSKLLLSSRNLVNNSDLLIKTLYVDIDNENIYSNSSVSNIGYIGKPNDLAYIMYTSGTTGKPKGVMVENKNIVRLVKNTNYINFEKTDRMLQTGSIVFDACTFEIWGALLNGLELYVIKKETLLDSNLLHKYILENKISILWLTAPLFTQLVEENSHIFDTVRCLLSGGDVLSTKHINKVLSSNPKIQLINGYGPTENTTFSCCHLINKKYKNSIPIGKPIANSTGYIVTSSGQLAPVGVPGELWVGGDGVSRGYINNPELTNSKFINNPFGNGKIYKTGDLTKWKPDGTIEFLGRIDNQIKIRGFRVELSEISSTISTYLDIKEVYTIFTTVNNEKCICSYIVGKCKIDIDILKNYLSKFLPKYMIPRYIIQLKRLPKNQNGKIAKNLLPEISIPDNTSKKIIEPSTPIELNIYNAFTAVLNTNSISTDDNFFDIGGDSLSAMKLQIELMKNDIHITYADIFKYPTIQSMANYIVENRDDGTDNSFIESYTNYDKLISTNTITDLNCTNIEKTPIGNVLLTGVTGFLGAHILDSYLKQEQGTIYCLIRDKNHTPALDRLKNVLHFYFNDKYDNYIGSRIKCIDGDITLKNLGLDEESFKLYGKNIDTVIHSAALVKHFGNYKSFDKINVEGTKNVIDFCLKFNIRLMHISTLSVSGNDFVNASHIENTNSPKILYGENKFYIGQGLDNLYVRSKFLAEKAVLDARELGLNAYILRMGNLTSRFSEGKFQQNHMENAFVNRIKSFLQLQCLPDYIMNGIIEFTPIDYSSDAIIKLANHYNKNFSIFHLFNSKYLTMKHFYEILNELGITLEILPSKKFKKLINSIINDPEKSNIIEGIIRDFDSNQKLVYESNIELTSDFTDSFLQKLDFEWPEIDKNYIRKYLSYLIEIGYLNINLKEI